MASSQRPILEAQDDNIPLEPPVVPFAGSRTPASPAGSLRTVTPPVSVAHSSTSNSLSGNFLPSKFPAPQSLYQRKAKGIINSSTQSKQGGGREAFGSKEARMPEEKDDDYDGVDFSRRNWKASAPLRWNRFKWTLFWTNFIVSVYSLTALIICLLTWLNVWSNADVIRVGNRTLLVLSTIASSFGILSSLVGSAGILLNNRGFLAVYTVLLWITFAFICAPGYLAYKTRTFNLEGKINAQWSQALGETGRLRIQNSLGCCGYFSPFVEATISQLCYARSVLPGCKNPYLKFERMTLGRWYGIAFGLVPFHLLAILAALLCSNHVTYRFGKGMMPKAYRLDMNAMALIMDHWASQLADQYGSGVASEVISRTRSNLQLDCVPTLGYNSGAQMPGTASGNLPGASSLREQDALLEDGSMREIKKS
ncbi:hypothetical protein ACEPAF_2176 [Sanghuangporus sanghuang]